MIILQDALQFQTVRPAVRQYKFNPMGKIPGNIVADLAVSLLVLCEFRENLTQYLKEKDFWQEAGKWGMVPKTVGFLRR